MLPVGALMIEHRLIERMIRLLSGQLSSIRSGAIPEQDHLRAAVDFMRNYADRCHHGKEEGILFRELKSKPLSSEHQKMMGELIEEHVRARAMVAELDDALSRFCGGDYGTLIRISGVLEALIKLYPCHIEKEDKGFFLPSMEYFTEEEKDWMLRAFDEFDKELFTGQYRKMIEAQESAPIFREISHG